MPKLIHNYVPEDTTSGNAVSFHKVKKNNLDYNVNENL